MKDQMEALKDFGCDIDGALARTLNDRNFLLRCISSSLEQPEFEQLGKTIQSGDAHAAFEYAHALKGVLGNVGLTPLYECTAKMVEPLRAGSMENVPDEYGRLLNLRKEVCDLLNQHAE
jgi:HPt (histidine-containing phosphotransfer) domain-containing protein